MTSSIQTQKRKGERGNVLFLILIAVALFAALSYAVTQSTRSGGGDASKEKSLVSSASITQYPASIKTATVRMIVSGGVAVENLNFTKPAAFSNLIDPDVTTTGLTTANSVKNAVFHPKGGGATYTDGPSSVSSTGVAQAWVFNPRNAVRNVGTTATSGIDQATVDIIAFLPNMNVGVCQKIHEQLGMPYSTASADLAANFPLITGVDIATNMDYQTANNGIPASPGGALITSTVLDGQPQGCFRKAADNYVYYHVIVER